MFLLPVRLFSSSDSILAISFISGNWLTRGEWTHFPSFEKFWISKNIYLLFAEFSVRTVNYGYSFFPSNRWKKTRIFTVQTEKTRLIRCLLYGFFLFGGPETIAGRTIWQSFDRRQKRKFLLAHENNST